EDGSRVVKDSRRGVRVPDADDFVEWAIAMLADVGIITVSLDLNGLWNPSDPHDYDIGRAAILAYAKLKGMEAPVKCWAHQGVYSKCSMVTAYEALSSTSVRCSLFTPK